MNEVCILRVRKHPVHGHITDLEIYDPYGKHTIFPISIVVVIIEMSSSRKGYTGRINSSGEFVKGAEVIVVDVPPRKWLRTIPNGNISDDLSNLPPC